MIDRDTTFATLRTMLPELRRRWPIRSLGIFGSFARGDLNDSSDIDVLVEFHRPIALSSFLALEDALEQSVGCKVDLVSHGALKPFMRQGVMRDLIPL
jgi:predicted nucleotidyltransferase